jgi:hypothetical protein
MYAAVPRIIPSCVPCAAVSVGDCINVATSAGSRPGSWALCGRVLEGGRKFD